MALQLGALRDALIDAGATPAKADKAAEELAAYANRLGPIELRLERLSGKVRTLSWMAGTNIVLTLGVLWRLLSH